MSTPATVEISESNGGGPTVTDGITSIGMGSVDTPNMVFADHPLVIPTAGNVFSYKKWVRWHVAAWVDTTTITNFKWFKSAGPDDPTGWSELYTFDTNPAYASGRSNFAMSSGPWPKTAGTAQAVTGSFTNPTTGYSSYAGLSVTINSSTSSGLKGAWTITFRYDES